MFYIVDLLGQIHSFASKADAKRLASAGYYTTQSYFQAVCYAKSILLRGSKAQVHKDYFVNNL